MGRSRHIDRHRVGRKKYEYYDDEGLIKQKKLIAYFESLPIPPAWREVRISRSKNANILATGFDKAGRLQYLYNPRFRARQEKKKFERILRFAQALPRMRRVTDEHLSSPGLSKEKVLACIVRLMDEAYFRVGNEEYSKENQSYGVSTLRSKHITISGDSVTFDFVGKAGQHQHKRVTDRKVAKVIKRLDELPGYEIFKYIDENGQLARVQSRDVNAYIKEVMGEEFSAKDFRTWGGTLLATAELAAAKKADSENERKKIVTKCVARVARKLGNTPAIARSSYIDPRVINSYLGSGDLSTIRQTVRSVGRKSYLSQDERCVLKLLEG
jgi:DNA topoisomerase I